MAGKSKKGGNRKSRNLRSYMSTMFMRCHTLIQMLINNGTSELSYRVAFDQGSQVESAASKLASSIAATFKAKGWPPLNWREIEDDGMEG